MLTACPRFHGITLHFSPRRSADRYPCPAHTAPLAFCDRVSNRRSRISYTLAIMTRRSCAQPLLPLRWERQFPPSEGVGLGSNGRLRYRLTSTCPCTCSLGIGGSFGLPSPDCGCTRRFALSPPGRRKRAYDGQVDDGSGPQHLLSRTPSPPSCPRFMCSASQQPRSSKFSLGMLSRSPSCQYS